VLSSELLSYGGRAPACPYTRHSSLFSLWTICYYLKSVVSKSQTLRLAMFDEPVPTESGVVCLDDLFANSMLNVKQKDQPLPNCQCMACESCKPFSSGQSLETGVMPLKHASCSRKVRII
jgi:hypothetical protein